LICARRSSRGFTLIELVLVMLIIALLLAIVAPSLGGLMRSQKMDQSARTVAAMLAEARVRAASDAKPYRLVIETQDNTCWLEMLTPQGFQRPHASYGKIIELDEGLDLELDGGTSENGRLMVRVEPDGQGELAQIKLTRVKDGKQLAVACKTPLETYAVGDPVSSQELEAGGSDVNTDY